MMISLLHDYLHRRKRQHGLFALNTMCASVRDAHAQLALTYAAAARYRARQIVAKRKA